MTCDATPSAAPLPILVIEDEPAVAAYLHAALKRHGYEVFPASSGAEGLCLLATSDYRGVISDIRTPGGTNGAEVQEWIRTHRPELFSRTILITGDVANPETAALLGRYGTPCVCKPFRMQELISVVEKVLGKP
jgi:DNA-binding response OmpR family regulator